MTTGDFWGSVPSGLRSGRTGWFLGEHGRLSDVLWVGVTGSPWFFHVYVRWGKGLRFESWIPSGLPDCLSRRVRDVEASGPTQDLDREFGPDGVHVRLCEYDDDDGDIDR